jgi:predicted MFS family arabinose efflux permease
VDKNKNLATFLCLYIAQSIPMSFLSTIIPVIMRQENFTLTQIGMLQLIKLPWILKFLWSPVIDRHTTTIRHYKQWIITSELLYAITILTITTLNITTNFPLILTLVIIAFITSATQDIATDALAILTFPKKDKSLINSIQTTGNFLGTLIGSGLLLLLYHKTGWNATLPLLAITVIIAIIPLYRNHTIKINKTTDQRHRATLHDIHHFFTQKNIHRQILFLALYSAPLIGALAMLRPYLVDTGHTIKQIGIMSGTVGTTTGIIAAATGGLLIRRIGRRHSMHIFATLTLFTTFYFHFISHTPHPDPQLLYLGIILLWGSYGTASVTLYTLAMDQVRPGREGTDFTIQIVITHLSGIIIAALSGRIADQAGYSTLFLFQFLLACISLTYILTTFRTGKHTT